MSAAPSETQCDLSHGIENERTVSTADLLPKPKEGNVSLSLRISATLGLCALPTSVFLTVLLPDGRVPCPPSLV